MKRFAWVGHKTALRRLTSDGWLYKQAENQSYAVRAMVGYGVSLPDLDEFIERLEADGVGAGDELRQRRAMLGSDFLRHLEWIKSRFDEIVNNEKNRAKVSQIQASRRTGKGKLNESQKHQIRREYEAAPVQYGARKQLAGKYGVSEDTIERVIGDKKTR